VKNKNNFEMKGEVQMSKKFRGKGIAHLPGKGKGICPICQRTSIKVLWNYVNEEGKTIKVCKNCRNH
jgi:uncharacterized radical SAM superfamily Fe-S cluster-containing enzyme